jgi:hypothetical protein
MVVRTKAREPMPVPVAAAQSQGAVAGARSRPVTPMRLGMARVMTSRVWLRHRRVQPGTSHIMGRPMAIETARHAPAVAGETPASRRMPGSQPMTRNVTVEMSPKWMVRAVAGIVAAAVRGATNSPGVRCHICWASSATTAHRPRPIRHEDDSTAAGVTSAPTVLPSPSPRVNAADPWASRGSMVPRTAMDRQASAVPTSSCTGPPRTRPASDSTRPTRATVTVRCVPTRPHSHGVAHPPRPIAHSGRATSTAATSELATEMSGRAAPRLVTAGRRLMARTKITTVEAVVVARVIAPPRRRGSERGAPWSHASRDGVLQTSVR